MSKLYKNASGYYDPTAYGALLNVSSHEFDSEKTKKFVDDIFKVCRLYNIHIEGELNIVHRKTGKFLRKVIINRYKKGDLDGGGKSKTNSK